MPERFRIGLVEEVQYICPIHNRLQDTDQIARRSIQDRLNDLKGVNTGAFIVLNFVEHSLYWLLSHGPQPPVFISLEIVAGTTAGGDKSPMTIGNQDFADSKNEAGKAAEELGCWIPKDGSSDSFERYILLPSLFFPLETRGKLFRSWGIPVRVSRRLPNRWNHRQMVDLENRFLNRPDQLTL